VASKARADNQSTSASVTRSFGRAKPDGCCEPSDPSRSRPSSRRESAASWRASRSPAVSVERTAGHTDRPARCRVLPRPEG
jgi:hypothetical protein